MSVLVIDVGTSGLRAATVRADGTVHDVNHRMFPPSSPSPGLVEFDALAMSAAIMDVTTATLEATSGAIDAIGITAQRASTIVWDRATGEPVGPALGWQDLRTVFECIMAKSDHNLALAPNQSATKVAWLLNTYDPERSRDLLFGTVDSWIAWTISGGALHITDHTNAAVTGLYDLGARVWSAHACEALGIPMRMLPTLVDSTGDLGTATAIPGAPMIGGLAGDQQASLIGQGCVRPGMAKVTFGTGGMLDLCTGTAAPADHHRSKQGTFPIVAWTRAGDDRKRALRAAMVIAGRGGSGAEVQHAAGAECDLGHPGADAALTDQ